MSASGSSWSTVRSALVADALRGGSLKVRGQIHGESMLPTLWPGDVIEIESCSLGELRLGDIVLAQRDHRLVLHRLVAPCGPDGFWLRGDSVPRPDPLFPPEALLGRLVRSGEERAGSLNFLRPLFSIGVNGSSCARALGMLLYYCGVARRAALKLHSLRKPPLHELKSVAL